MEVDAVSEDALRTDEKAVTPPQSPPAASIADEPTTIQPLTAVLDPISASAPPETVEETALTETADSEPVSMPYVPVKAETEEPVIELDAVPAATLTSASAKKKKSSSSARKDSTSASSSKLKKAPAKKSSSSSAKPRTKQELSTPSPPPSVDQEDVDEEEDPNLYCICQSRFDDVEGGMIMCDRCDLWFHYKCMGITHDNVDLVDQFICPPCETQTGEHTTYKEACARAGCRRTAMKPFSRYCSQRCGVLQVAAKMQNLKLVQNPAVLDTLHDDARVKRARRAEGSTELNPDRSDNTAWNSALQESVLYLQTANMTAAERFRFLNAAAAGPSRTASATADHVNGDHVRAPIPRSAPAPLAFVAGLEREPAILRKRLTALDLQKTRINAALDSLDQRSTLLHLVSDRAPTLPHVGASSVTSTVETAEEPSIEEAAAAPAAKSKSSKKKKAADTSGSSGPRCGYDERLHWDDETFDAWAQSTTGRSILSHESPLDGRLDDDDEALENDAMDTGPTPHAGHPRICGLSKRKCKRHVDWSNLKESSFDVEKSVLNHESQKVTEEKLQLERYLQEVQETIVVAKQLQAFDEERKRIVEAKRDEDLARLLASEGSRRQRY